MKRNRLRKAARKVVLTATMALAAAGVLQASVVSDPVTASKWTMIGGDNLLSAPVHPTPVFSGKVLNVSADTVTINGTLASSTLGPVDLTGFGNLYYQHVLIVRNDNSADGAGTQGDWFTIEDNGTGSIDVTAQPDFGDTDTRIGLGDIVEVYEMVSLKDLFGDGASVLVSENTTFFDSTSGDLFTTLDGVSFLDTLFYHDGSDFPEGWYLNNFANIDPDKYRFAPDQAFYYTRNVGPDFDVVTSGVLQAYKLSHYVPGSSVPIATGYPVDAPVGESGLQESGFAPNNVFFGATETIDIVDPFGPLSFLDSLQLYSGTGGPPLPAGWYVNNFTLDNNYPLTPGTGFFVNSAGIYVWRQEIPFVP